MLDRYGIERVLYRIDEDSHAGRFVLKGAQLPHDLRADPTARRF